MQSPLERLPVMILQSKTWADSIHNSCEGNENGEGCSENKLSAFLFLNKESLSNKMGWSIETIETIF